MRVGTQKFTILCEIFSCISLHLREGMSKWRGSISLFFLLENLKYIHSKPPPSCFPKGNYEVLLNPWTIQIVPLFIYLSHSHLFYSKTQFTNNYFLYGISEKPMKQSWNIEICFMSRPNQTKRYGHVFLSILQMTSLGVFYFVCDELLYEIFRLFYELHFCQ